MSKKIIFSSLFALTLLVANSASAHNSSHHSWWQYFWGHKNQCHKHEDNSARHYYWAKFFWWHNHCPNNAPTANAGEDQDTSTGTFVTLDGSASSDDDGYIKRYRWKQIHGPRVKLKSRRSTTANFTAPEVDEVITLKFLLIVKDNLGKRDYDTVAITVNPSVPSEPPIANAGIDQIVDEANIVTLDGTLSSDPDDDITEYLWEQIDGTPVILDSSTAVSTSFIAPDVNAVETLSFNLTVIDSQGHSASDTVDILVEPVVDTSSVNIRTRTIDGSLVSGVELAFYTNGVQRDDLNATVDETATLVIDADVDYSISTSVPGYAIQVVPFRSAAVGNINDLDITLIPRGDVITIPAAGSFSEEGNDGASVSFTTSDFVDSNGNPVSGDIQLTITPVDVSQPATLAAFPGEFTGIVEGSGDETPIISLGTVEFEFTANGQAINLAEGATADVLIPIYTLTYQDGSPVNVGDTIPLWSLDEETGIWDQEGTGTVIASIDSPTGLAMSATVSHFSWWNCDVSMSAAQVSVTVLGPNAGTATVFGNTAASIGWRPSTVDTTVAVNAATNPLFIPSNVETCLWAEVNFVDGSSVTTPQQCITPSSNQNLSLTFIAGSTEPLDVFAFPNGNINDVITLNDFIESPIDTIKLTPLSVETAVTYTVINGFLPAGVTLTIVNGTEAEISGIATESGIFTTTILATDSDNNTDEIVINLEISSDLPPPELRDAINFFPLNQGLITIDLTQFNSGGRVSTWSLSISETPQPVWLSLNNTSGLLTIDPSLIENEDNCDGECQGLQFFFYSSSVKASNSSGASTVSISLSSDDGGVVFRLGTPRQPS